LTPPEQPPLEQAPPEQAPYELTTDKAMFRAFGPPSDEDDEENEGDEADEEEEEDGGQHQDGVSRTRASTRMGPSIGSYF
jgi:hypothetical protein